MTLAEAIEAEDVATRIIIAARHEAGHAVIAARKGIPLRVEGIMVGQDGQGLSCYCKKPTGTDASVEANVIASFAGCYSENHFRRLQGYPERDYGMLMGSLDWIEARTISGQFSNAYWAGKGLKAIQKELEIRAEQDVAADWATIEALAQKLLSKDWEPKKALKSGAVWSDANLAKYVSGDEIVEFLVDFQINAVCVQSC